jgi:predicted transglutaminase-like cysteine proteinase
MARSFSRLVFVACLLPLAACATAPADLGPVSAADAIPQTDLIASSAMPDGTPTDSAPAGFISFCSRFMDQCAGSSNAQTIHLDLSTQALLAGVNRKINRAIVPESDEAHYGIAEYWNIPTDGYGNCHDYALAKRKSLIDAGFPERALRVAIVVTPREERHAVLTVATDRGDLVLDNLTDVIKPWTDVHYDWIERQDDGGELGWVSFATMASNGTTRPTAETK